MLESSGRSSWRNADPFMLITTLILIGFGYLTIYSADGRDAGFGGLAFRHLLFALIGSGVMVTLAALDYRLLRSLTIPIYAAGILLLILVMTPLGFAEVGTGAQRWFNLGVTTFQPSEPAKLALIIALAAFIAACGPRIRSPFAFVATGLIAAIPAALIFIEPDLGTSLILVAIWCGMIAVSRTRPIYLLATVFASIPVCWVAWHYLLLDYQKRRLLVFRNPMNDGLDGLGDGYHIRTAQITIGQAGLLGHPFDVAAEVNQGQRLSVSTTDFAFAHAIGNFGFIGAVALFVLFLLLIWRYLRVVQLAADEFGQLLAIGAASMFFFQTFVNIGMNVGIVPVVGIPLPFISGGGTSMIVLLATQGILQSVLMHREKLKFDQR